MSYQSKEHPALTKRSDTITNKTSIPTVEYDASLYVVKLWMKKLAHSYKFRSVVFVGLSLTVLLSLAFFVTGCIFIISQGLDFFRDTAIIYISFRSLLFLLVFVPWIFFSMNLDIPQDLRDREAFHTFQREAFVLLNPTWYYTAGYLYDTREARNRKDVTGVLMYVLLATIVFIMLLGHGVHRIHNMEGQYVPFELVDEIETLHNITTVEATKAIQKHEIYQLLLPVVGTLCTIMVFEAVFILGTFHAFYRTATPPPYSIFKPAKED